MCCQYSFFGVFDYQALRREDRFALGGDAVELAQSSRKFPDEVSVGDVLALMT
jgi:hypothetical protein